MNIPMLVVAAAVGLVLYSYALYPAVLWLWGRFRPHGGKIEAAAAGLPSVTIAVPVYNEQAQIRGLIESLLRLDYPEEKRQILIVSDASTDGTDEIVREYADRGVELVRQPERRGKTAAENAVRSLLRGEIVVNTDASIRIAPEGVRRLVAYFADPTVGVASGRDISVAKTGDEPNAAEAGYVGYEMWVRDLETRVYGIVGASGCFYAIRPELHRYVLPDALSRDFASAMIAREAGYRAVSVSDALCYVPRTSNLRNEYRRKVRTITRGMATLHHMRALLNPFRYGVFAWMLFSHKVCRWATPWAAAAAAVALPFVVPGWLQLPVLAAAAAGLGMALVGWRWPEGRGTPRAFSFPAYLVAGNVAVMQATVKALRGERAPIWEPTRREVGAATRAALVLLGLGLLAGPVAAPVAAQSRGTGAIGGVVTDAQGIPLGDVLVTLREVATGQERTQRTALYGQFMFTFAAPGEYAVRLEKLGYEPQRVAGVPVQPTTEARLAVELHPLGSSAGQTEVSYGGPARAAGAEWLDANDIRAVPGARMEAAEIARRVSQATDDFAVQGLPPWLSALAVDGTLFRPATHPLMYGAPYRTTGFPLRGLGGAQWLSSPLDAEWGGAAGVILSTHLKRGAGEGSAGLLWSGSALPGPSFRDGGVSYNHAHGGIALTGGGAGARYTVGAEVRRLDVPLAPAFPDNATAAELVSLAQSAGVDLTADLAPGTAPADAYSVYGRVDWAVTPRQQLGSWLHFAALPRTSGFDPRSGRYAELEGADLVAGTNLVSPLGTRTTNDLRVQVAHSARESAAAGVPQTTVVDGGLGFGAGPAARAAETRFRLINTLHVRTGRHAVKVGAETGFTRHDHEHALGGEFFFGGAPQLATGTGVFVRTAPTGRAQWTAPELAVFLQDTWDAGAGVQVLLAARSERESLPVDDVQLDTEWQRLSGLRNEAVGSAQLRAALRLGVLWDVQRDGAWVLELGGGIFHDRIDPLLLATWQMDDGSVRVRRDAGAVGWPAEPAGVGAVRRLTVLAPDFEAPRTARLELGTSHRLANGLAVNVRGTARRTEYLPRRTDLNALPLPVERDQFGRGVFGTLVQQGGLLVAEPGSGRRFDGYDEVAGLTADGWSEYAGATVGIDAALTPAVDLTLRYTLSRTRDNWFMARTGGWLEPLPQGLGEGDWTEGVSDFDVPHVAVAALAARGPIGSRIGVLYRLQSGEPFTPGFRAGVDAGGDGSHRNDPAFVDLSVAGVQQVAGRWSCVADAAGGVVGRNACRGAMRHGLDVSLAFPVLRVGRGTAALALDALDVLESEMSIPDAALYLVDPAASLTRDAAARTVAVPLVVNPNFGEDVPRSRAGRRFRLGFSVVW